MILRVGPLADDPLDAAAQFHAGALAEARAILAGGETSLVLVFTAAGHAHRGWRLAAVQGLAREHAPRRVNGLAGDSAEAIAAAAEWLNLAPAVTGQYLSLAGKGAGALL